MPRIRVHWLERVSLSVIDLFFSLVLGTVFVSYYFVIVIVTVIVPYAMFILLLKTEIEDKHCLYHYDCD